MEHSRLAVPSKQGAKNHEDGQELIRTIYFGEALRAVQTYVSESLLSGPSGPMNELLGEAFDRLRELPRGFTPEEFTTYYMSILLELCEDTDEARRLRRGAMKYIIASAAALPPEFSAVVEDARRALAADGIEHEAHSDPTRSSSHRLALLLAQDQERHRPANTLDNSISRLTSSPPPDAYDPPGNGELSDSKTRRSRTSSSSRKTRPMQRTNSATPSSSGWYMATFAIIAFVLYLSLVAMGFLEPAIDHDPSTW